MADDEAEDVSSFAARFRLALGGESVYSFAQRSGIPDTTLRKYLKDSVPGLETAVIIADTANVNLDWLASGRGPMRPGSAIPSTTVTLLDENDIPEGTILVPRLDVEASAGGGLLPVSDQVVGHIGLPEQLLRAEGINPSRARILQAKGDSMFPTIRDRDLLVVDTSINQVIDERIYIVVWSGLVLLKRVFLGPGRSLILKSDNPLYEPLQIGPEEIGHLHVPGRVGLHIRAI